MKKLLALGLLLTSPAAFSAGVESNNDKFDQEFANSGRYSYSSSPIGGYIQGGVTGALNYTVYDRNDSYDEADMGVGFNVKGGFRFKPGFEVMLSYSSTSHDTVDHYDSDDYLIESYDGVTYDDFRAGFFYAPPHKTAAAFRIGLGYVQLSEKYDGNDRFSMDGHFFEAGVSVDAGKYVTIDVGAAYLSMYHNEDGDADGVEFSAGGVYHVGLIDIGLIARAQTLDIEGRDDPFYEGYKNLYIDYRLTVGTQFGYNRGRRR